MRFYRTALFAAAVAAAFATPAAAQPNVVLIVTDDQRAGTLRYMPTVQSELAAKGVSFPNAFVVNPVCCPSRASILTGRWSHSTGVWSNVPGPFGAFPAFGDLETLPVWLQRAGYRTMLAGKYLNGYKDPYALPSYVPPGWERWLAFWSGRAYYDYELTDGTQVVGYGADEGSYSTDVLTGAAVDFVGDPDERPFFLYFAPYAPHWDYNRLTVPVAARHAGAYAGLPPHRARSLNERNVADKPAFIRRKPPVDMAAVNAFRQQQLESLLAVDEAVAQLLVVLEETGRLADTLIVFTSDNGYAWGEHRWFQKTAAYEESIRVPLVARWDAGFAPRKVRRHVLNVDLAPTIAAAAEAATVGVEGKNLLPLARGEAVPWKRRRFLIEQQGGTVPAYCAIRGYQWKFVLYANGQQELYQLRRDPHELRSVHRSKPRVVKRMRARIARSECRPPGF